MERSLSLKTFIGTSNVACRPLKLQKIGIEEVGKPVIMADLTTVARLLTDAVGSGNHG